MKKLKFISLALVLMLGVVVFTGSGCTQSEETQEPNQGEEQSVSDNNSEKVEEIVSVVINYGDEEKTYEIAYEEGMTAYDALQKVVEKDSIEIKTTGYDFGMSVDSIGENIGGVDGQYWMYYVDGTTSPVAVDKQELTEGMKVEFKYEASTM